MKTYIPTANVAAAAPSQIARRCDAHQQRNNTVQTTNAGWPRGQSDDAKKSPRSEMQKTATAQTPTDGPKVSLPRR